MTASQSWRTEHADTPPPAEIEALLGRQFGDERVYDSSWKNDESPSYTWDKQVLPCGEYFVTLFWAHDATLEAYDTWERYTVNRWERGDIVATFDTDDVSDAVAHFVNVVEEMEKDPGSEMSPEDYANSEEYKRRVAEMKAKG